MRDIDIITKAMDDARAVLFDYIEPGPRDLRPFCNECLRS
jgi:hypothetical protein